MAWIDDEKIKITFRDTDYYFLEYGIGGYVSCDKYGKPIDKDNPPETWDLLAKKIMEDEGYENTM